MVNGCLLSKNILIQRDRIRDAIRRVDPNGVSERRKQSLHRREYYVPGPNSLWHIDGNHKLIRWRIVIHGGVDGYSRIPVFLSCANSNSSMTMFTAFAKGLMEYGLPQKVRSDKGGENSMVCSFMMNHPLRGPERGAFITGRSVHNQRIERFWKDLFTGCTSKFYKLFYRMEDMGILNYMEDDDLAALHYVFLPIIQDHLESFRQSFLMHKIRTERNKSPLQLWQTAVNSGWNIEEIPLDDIRSQLTETEQIRLDSHIHVPIGMRLSDQQERHMRQEFDLSVADLGDENDQMSYFTAVKRFVSEQRQNPN